MQYDINLGKEYSITMNIPFIDESESLVLFFSTFNKHNFDSFDSFNDDITLNDSKNDIAYKSIVNNNSFNYDHFLPIHECSCV